MPHVRIFGRGKPRPAPCTLCSVPSALRSALSLTLLTCAVLLVHGFHPYADDAGIYTAGVLKLANPALFQPDAAFVLANTRLSVFPYLLAALMRGTGISLNALLLGAHLLTIYAFLLACLVLVRRVFSSTAARWSAVTLAAACFTLPAAGSALLLMDPYVTPRSFSTPLGLFALAAVIDRKIPPHRALLRAALLLILAALMHPLMAAYAAAIVLVVFLIDQHHARLAVALSAMGPLAAAVLYLANLHTYATPAYRQAILLPVHSYLFPLHWVHRDYIGVVAPIAYFAILARRLGSRSPAGRISIAALLVAISSTVSAFLFIHPGGPYLLARLQPMRSFQMLFVIAVLLTGGFLGSYLADRARTQSRNASRLAPRLALIALPLATAAVMFFVQRYNYPSSAHIEWPGETPRNPWQQVFLWIRDRTPANAVFAATPDLISLDGEDSQGFRPIALRSLLANDKDSGVVVVFPGLAGQWATERNPQEGIDQLSDAERTARLRPLGVTWLLLSSTAASSLHCPFRNSVALICQLVSPSQSSAAARR